MHKILVAEDDNRLATLVKDYLEKNNFSVAVEHNGDHVIQRMAEFSPDLIVLDLMLPEKDGLSICRQIRQHHDTPILILTARNENADQIIGLEFGADDYVIKPAEPRVLLARIRALLRRHQQNKPSDKKMLAIGGLEINFAAREVKLNGASADLSSHEFDLLTIFANNAGKVLSRDVLFENLYNRPYDGLDRTIDVRISQLRKKIGDDSDNPSKIKTVWGKGYLFVPDAW